jgi:lipopolysaccharide transport protein LptA
MTRRNTLAGQFLLASAVLGALPAILINSGADAQQAKPAAKPASKPAAKPEASDGSEPQKLQLGDTVITADQLDYDLEKKQYLFTGKEKVELVSKESRMTARKMTVLMNAENQLAWAKCEGDVYVEKKDPENGSLMTAVGKQLDYYELEQKANLVGDVTVRQESPKLAKPMVVTGDRVDMDMKAKVNIVHRSPGAQAKAHVEPKGTDGKPGEPVDLIADRIEVNSDTQAYVATGKPVMIRPTSRLEARRLRFTVDPMSNDVKIAYADGDVVFDSKNEKGATLHATADDGTYDKAASQVKLIGHVKAASKEPEDEKPTLYECGEFEYNTVTGYRSMRRDVKVTLPEKPKPAAADANAKTDKPASEKSNDKK